MNALGLWLAPAIERLMESDARPYLIIKALDIQNVARKRSHTVSEVDTAIIITSYIGTVAPTFNITLIALFKILILATLCSFKICVFWKILF